MPGSGKLPGVFPATPGATLSCRKICWLLQRVLDALLPLLTSGHIPPPICLHLPGVVKVLIDCGVMVSVTLVSWQ